MRRLEERFPRELAVIGVHSAKFPAEAETFNVRQAVMRHEIRHPVVNDRNFVLWRSYAVRAWPTLVIIDPEGRVIGQHAGELHGEEMDALEALIGEIVRAYDAGGKIDRTPLPMLLEKQKQVETLLSFPGKVLADLPGSRLFVADTDHHRIAVFSMKDGRLIKSFGGGPGFADGGAGHARFRAPQGMALRDEILYVADTENHAVRKISLDSGHVTTLAGTGQQATPWPLPGPARSAALNSPWDVLLEGELLYVAMAGAHQLWTIHLPSGRLELFAGDGREALQDGPPPLARLAQPSGLASDGRDLWFVDSETSSLRSVPLSGRGEVRTHVGRGLFDFGDADGPRETALLQHPLGVACADGLVYLADAYNNRIKVFDPAEGRVRGLSGSGEPGLHDGPGDQACFWEPGGVSAAGGYLYAADTNNHAIRLVDARTGEAHTLDLQ